MRPVDKNLKSLFNYINQLVLQNSFSKNLFHDKKMDSFFESIKKTDIGLYERLDKHRDDPDKILYELIDYKSPDRIKNSQSSLCLTTFANELRYIFEALKFVLNEAIFDFNVDGSLKLNVVDSRFYCAVNMEVGNGIFHKIYKNISIGIDLDKVYKILKNLSSSDILLIELVDSGQRLVFYSYDLEFNLKSHCSINTKILERTSNLNGDFVFFNKPSRIKAADFQKWCRDILNIDSMKIEISSGKDGLVMRNLGGSVEQENCFTNGDNDGVYSIKNGSLKTVGVFEMRYLNNFSKSYHVSKYVEIGITVDVVLVLMYSLERFGKLHYILDSMRI